MDIPHNMGTAEVKGSTPNGLWVVIEDLGEEEVFIPHSQVHEDSEVYMSDSPPGDLIISTWLAEQRGWL